MHADQIHHGFHRAWIGFGERQVHQWDQRAVQSERFLRFSVGRELIDLAPGAWQQACRHHDAATRARRDMQRKQRVLPAQNRERLVDAGHGAQEMPHVGIARLHADDPLVLREFVQHFGRDRNAGAIRNLIDQDRQRRFVGVTQEVVANAALGRIRVVGRQHQQAVRTRCGEFLACLHGVVISRVEHARDDRDAARRFLGGDAGHADAFGTR